VKNRRDNARCKGPKRCDGSRMRDGAGARSPRIQLARARGDSNQLCLPRIRPPIHMPRSLTLSGRPVSFAGSIRSKMQWRWLKTQPSELSRSIAHSETRLIVFPVAPT